MKEVRAPMPIRRAHSGSGVNRTLVRGKIINAADLICTATNTINSCKTCLTMFARWPFSLNVTTVEMKRED